VVLLRAFAGGKFLKITSVQIFHLVQIKRDTHMHANVSPQPYSDGLIQRIFTDPTSQAYMRWVSMVNFWILVSCLSLAGETVEPYATQYANVFTYVEFGAVAFFTLDYLGNLYFAKDRVKYFFSFWGLVDLISIMPTYLMLLNLTALQGTKVFRVLRVVRVLRVLKMARIALQQFEKKLETSNPILTNLKIYFIALFSVVMISSTLMYYVEGDLYSAEAITTGQAKLDAQIKATPLPADAAPEASKFMPVDPISGNPIPEDKRFFTSIPATMWWCMVTLTTTGYGDMFPLTFGGRFIAAVTMLLGLVLFGILLNIVGKTIMVLLFGEHLTDDTAAPATREGTLQMMVSRKWISESRANELALMSEEDIKGCLKNI
jgi:voltage-gated potassium channel